MKNSVVYHKAVAVAGLCCRYNEKIDELRIYREYTKDSVVFVQAFSRKFTGEPEMSIELLAWLSTRYEEVKLAI